MSEKTVPDGELARLGENSTQGATPVDWSDPRPYEDAGVGPKAFLGKRPPAWEVR